MHRRREFSQKGDLVVGHACPKCNQLSVVYNGNYFCALCDWAMPEHGSAADEAIVTAYLMQKYQEAVRTGDTKTADSMAFYLKDRLPEVETS